MPSFCLTTTWLIPAPLDKVWSALIDTESWPDWWPYVESVTETFHGSPSGSGNVRNYSWRTCLPYRLQFNLRVTALHPMRLVTVAVAGDLEGEGKSHLAVDAATGQTRITFCWRVRTRKNWMNWFGLFCSPIFRWNHTRVMKRGEQGLIRFLNC